jgi:hypothetical protein
MKLIFYITFDTLIQTIRIKIEENFRFIRIPIAYMLNLR